MESVSAYMERDPMNYIITIASLLLFDGSFQTLPAVRSERLDNQIRAFQIRGSFQTLPAVRSERLEGTVVMYDAWMNLRTSQADFIVKLKTSDGKKYIRLRYSPHAFMLFSPLPKEMFSDGSVVWIFQAYSPRNPVERGACTGQIKRYLPGKDGLPVEVERFASVPGQESEIIPKPESLSCLIMEDWTLKEK